MTRGPAWLSHYRRQSGRDLLKAAFSGFLVALLLVLGGIFLMVMG